MRAVGKDAFLGIARNRVADFLGDCEIRVGRCERNHSGIDLGPAVVVGALGQKIQRDGVVAEECARHRIRPFEPVGFLDTSSTAPGIRLAVFRRMSVGVESRSFGFPSSPAGADGGTPHDRLPRSRRERPASSIAVLTP